MERKILFKAKRLDNGEWVEGDLTQTKEGKAFIHINTTSFSSICPVYQVDPSTICQFTGFKDGKDQDVYENDIIEYIKYPDNKLCVEWLENRYVFRKVSGEVETYNLITPGFLKNYAVVGSKFDGKYKELLQEYKGYTLHDPSDLSVKMTLADFVDGCISGCLIDDDGVGYYGTRTKESDLEISPSDVVDGGYRTDFTYVYWYNK